jgi:hypothetical protein
MLVAMTTNKIGGAGSTPTPDVTSLEPAQDLDLADPGARVDEPAKPLVTWGSAPRPSSGAYGSILAARMNEVPVTGGLKGDWNKLVTKGLKEIKDVNLANEAEKALVKLFASKLKEHAPGAPPEHLDAMAAEMAKAIRNSPFPKGGIDALAKGAEEYLDDAGGYLAKKLTFTKMEAEVREQVKAEGGLNPGEDKKINADKAAPLAKEIVADANRIKAKAYFKPDVKLDVVKLFSAPEKMIKRIDATTGVKFESSDFKGSVNAKLSIDGPLTKDATLTATGWAEVTKGNFEGRVEGTAKVIDIYGDPTFGPTADLSMKLKYTDPSLGVSAHLGGNVHVPLQRDAKLTWDATAGIEKQWNKNVSTTLGAGVSGGQGLDTSYNVNAGLKIVF